MRHAAILIVLTVLLAACSSTDARSEADEARRTAEARLVDCVSDAGRGSSAILVEPKFEEMQRIIREEGVDALDEEHRIMFDALQEPTVLGQAGISYVDYLGPAYTPGETTMAELREEAGLLEVLQFSLLASALWDDERSELFLRYRETLKQECEANNVEALVSICARTETPESCRDFDRYKDRDPAVVAEACALAPYLAPCEPENPLPYYPPDVRDDYRLRVPDDPR